MSKNILFGGLLFSAYGHALCWEDYGLLIDDVYKHETVNRLESICEAWHGTELLIVATSIYRDDSVDLGVLVVEPASKKIVARMREAGALTGTAIYNSGPRIDAVSYKLGHDVPAFGIRTSWKNSSGPNPYSFESLSLYVVQAENVVGVLHGINMEERSGEWDTRCSGEFETREMELSVRPSKGSYADLMVGEKLIRSFTRQTADGCKKTVRDVKVKKYILRFDGVEYPVPKALKSLEH